MKPSKQIMRFVGIASLAFLSLNFLTCKKDNSNHALARFRYVVGIVGNPMIPENDWSDQQLKVLKELGFNMLQLNIAWDSKPGGEVLNMEDLDEKHLAQFRYRINQAKKFGFQALPHFGVPKILKVAPGEIRALACILDPEVRKKYRDLMIEFFKTFPEVNDVMIYTYDQHAWLCYEFGQCPHCGGIPLHERLPSFLNMLMEAIQEVKPGARLWWQPWEISAGQAYKIVQAVNPEHFGIMLNNAIGEVYYQNTTDLFVRNLVRLAADRRIPVIGEIAMSGWGIGGSENHKTPCPRLVLQQIRAFDELDGVVGIKEHFGNVVSKAGVNEAMFRAYLRSPGKTLEQLLQEIAIPYGEKAAPLLIEAWEQIAQAMEFVPFETNYAYPPLYTRHSWDSAEIEGQSWHTPAWKSNRRAFFMLTEPTEEVHPWLYEDVGLRLFQASEKYYRAARIFDKIMSFSVSHRVEDIRDQREAALELAKGTRGRALHILETLAVEDARFIESDPPRWEKAVERLRVLLKDDLKNQNNDPEMKRVLEAFETDPKEWLRTHLVRSILGKGPKLD